MAGNSVTVGSQVFTAVSASPTSIQFVVGADDSTTATNLAAAINAHPAVSVVVSAVAAASVVNLTAKIAGISGNYLSLGSNLTSAATPSGTSLAGGSGTGKGVITVLGLQFKDLNGDGLLEPYEDWRLLEICRAKDLVSRMTTAQKIGLMSEGALFFSSDSAIPASVMALMSTANVRQGLLRPAFGATQSAVYVNRLNELAESLPLGVPVVVGADPGHATNVGMAASGNLEVSAPTQFTPWPGTLGLGAINDRDLTFQHADMVRQEFQASGIRWQFGPLADIATEPRWYRVGGTFGSNALLAAKHVEQMVSGFQNSLTGNLRNGIAATVMHFPGHGPEWKGMDAHSDFGRYTVYPGNNFEYHLIPFQAAFDAGAAALMPALAIEKLQYDVDPLQVPSAFSYELITLVAKKQMGFRGLVTSDWCTMGTCGISVGGNGYNMEGLSFAERAALHLHAGSHQLGNESASAYADAYSQGLITDADVDAAAARILEMSVKLGLFENPYVDSSGSASIVRSAANRALGFLAMKRSIVLLKNGDHNPDPFAGTSPSTVPGRPMTPTATAPSRSTTTVWSTASSPALLPTASRTCTDPTITPPRRALERYRWPPSTTSPRRTSPSSGSRPRRLSNRRYPPLLRRGPFGGRPQLQHRLHARRCRGQQEEGDRRLPGPRRLHAVGRHGGRGDEPDAQDRPGRLHRPPGHRATVRSGTRQSRRGVRRSRQLSERIR